MAKKLSVKKSVPKKVIKPKPAKAAAKPKPKVTAKTIAKPKVQLKQKPKPKSAPKPELKSKQKTKPKMAVKVKPMTTAPPRAIYKEEQQGPYQEIKKMLERQKQALLAEAGATLESTLNPTSEGFPDWTDQASMEVDQNCVLRLREREQHLLNKIENAIERIDGETFGICEICNEPISLKRLKARPVTTLCIACKTKQEYEEKMRQ